MAITRVQVKSGGGDGAVSAPLTTGDFASSCTSGNYIIVCIRESGVLHVSTVTDTLGHTYDLAVKDETQDPFIYIYYKKLTSSGTNAVSATGDISDFAYPYIFAIEVSGLAAASALDQTDHKTGSGVTDCVSNSITTTQADEYVVMAIAQQSFNVYTAGSGYTLVDGTIPTNPNDFGGVQERITSGTISGVQHFTSDGVAQYTVAVATFKGLGAPADTQEWFGTFPMQKNKSVSQVGY